MSSISMRAINSPRASSTASLRRHANPFDSAWRTIRMRGSQNSATRSAPSSRDPSSMRTSSQSEKVCRTRERIAGPAVAAPSRIDMIIDTVGTGEKSAKQCHPGILFTGKIGTSTFTIEKPARQPARAKGSIAEDAPRDFINDSAQRAPEIPPIRGFSIATSQRIEGVPQSNPAPVLTDKTQKKIGVEFPPPIAAFAGSLHCTFQYRLETLLVEVVAPDARMARAGDDVPLSGMLEVITNLPRQIVGVPVGDQFRADAEIFREIPIVLADDKAARPRNFEGARLDLPAARQRGAG